MNKTILSNDPQFGSLLNSLSPAEKHRLLNLTREQLSIDISEGAGVTKSNFSFCAKDRKTQAKELRFAAKALRAKASQLRKQAKELV